MVCLHKPMTSHNFIENNVGLSNHKILVSNWNNAFAKCSFSKKTFDAIGPIGNTYEHICNAHPIQLTPEIIANHGSIHQAIDAGTPWLHLWKSKDHDSAGPSNVLSTDFFWSNGPSGTFVWNATILLIDVSIEPRISVVAEQNIAIK